MPATPARIGFILEEFRRSVAEDTAVQTAYGSLARKSDDPVTTWFDNTADADLVADARLDLMKASRRRFRMVIAGVDAALGLSVSGAIPVVEYTDDERDVSARKMLLADLAVDLNKNVTSIQVWG